MIKKLISKDLSINFLIKFFSPILGYLVVLLNSRYIEKSILGEILLGISYINIIASLSSLGFPQLATRNNFNKLSINKSYIYEYVLASQTFITFIGYLLLVKLIKINLIYIFISLLVITGNYFAVKLKVNNYIKAYNLTQSLILPIIQLLLLIFFIIKTPIKSEYYLITLFLSSFIFSYLSSKYFIISTKKDYNFNLGILKNFLITSLFIGISGFLSRLNTNIDNVMIGNICGVECLPKYKLHSIVLVASQLFCMTYNIRLSNQLAKYNDIKDLIKYKESIFKGVKVNILYNLLISPLIILFLPFITNLITDGNYTLSYNLIIIFILSGFSFSTVSFFILGNIYRGLEKIMIIINVIAICTNVIINFILIPILGIIGAAIATLFGSLVSLILCTSLFLRHSNEKK